MNAEIDSFVGKYKQLLSAGVKASLSLNGNNGCTKIILEAYVGESTPIYDLGTPSSRCYSRGPAYQRRQMRRRQDNQKKVEYNHDDVKLESDGSEESIPSEKEVHIEPCHESTAKNESFGKIPESGLNGENAEAQTGREDNVKDVVDSPSIDMVAAQSDLISVVYATAILENSTVEKMDKVTYESVFKVIDSKDHIKKNVLHVKVTDVHSEGSTNSKFRHELNIAFKVKTNAIWNSPRTYLWKHLGTSEWTLHDGTKLNFVKIHQK